MNGYKINDNLYINCDNIDYASFLNDKVKIHMNDNTSYYITQDQYADIETKIPQSGGSGGGSSGGGANITSNIKIVANKSSVLSSNHNKLCIVNDANDLSFKVVNKIGGGSEEISALSTTLSQRLSSACCSIYNDDVYIFGGDNKGQLNTIYKFNTTTETVKTLSATMTQKLQNACCATYGDNIYIIGGYYHNSSGSIVYSSTIYKFNVTTETYSSYMTLYSSFYGACCANYGDNIYIFGGSSSSGYLNTIYKFNTKTISKLSVTLPQSLSHACCANYGDNIYIFGGISSSGYLNTIYKFNTKTETIETLSTTLLTTLFNSCCSVFGDNIYIFGGRTGSSSLASIFKFNCTSETITTLGTTLPQTLNGTCCSVIGYNIYIFGGGYNTIYNFSVSFELTANNVLLYCANSKYNFDLITDQVNIPIKNIYIGDSNNTAKLANAYLYDETKSAWVNVNTGEVLS